MFKKELDSMTYCDHFKANWIGVRNCIKAKRPFKGFLHLLHGLIPCRWTDHHYWGL